MQRQVSKPTRSEQGQNKPLSIKCPVESYGVQQPLFDKPLWNCDDLAKILHISPDSVRKRVFRGRIPHVKVGKLLRFHPSDIEKWLRENHYGVRDVKDL